MFQGFKNEIVGLFVLALAVVFLIVVALAFVEFLEFVSSPRPTPTPAPTPSEEQGEDTRGVERWQTYRNEEFGFEVKYPNNDGAISVRKRGMQPFESKTSKLSNQFRNFIARAI